jgi:hypothetical protein
MLRQPRKPRSPVAGIQRALGSARKGLIKSRLRKARGGGAGIRKVAKVGAGLAAAGALGAGALALRKKTGFRAPGFKQPRLGARRPRLTPSTAPRLG